MTEDYHNFFATHLSGTTEKEARHRFKLVYPNTDIEKVESQGEIESDQYWKVRAGL